MAIGIMNMLTNAYGIWLYEGIWIVYETGRENLNVNRGFVEIKPKYTTISAEYCEAVIIRKFGLSRGFGFQKNIRDESSAWDEMEFYHYFLSLFLLIPKRSE